MLELNPGLIIWTIITFALLIFILAKVAWKPLVGALEERENGIREALSQAENARKEAERLIAENKKAFDKANETTSQILKEGRELAEKMKNDIVDKARESANLMMNQAKEEISREKELALNSLKNEVADLAIFATEKILGQVLDKEAQKKYLDKTLEQLPRN